MSKTTRLGAALLATMLGMEAAEATGFHRAEERKSGAHFTTAAGTTLPPVGFVNFCARNPRECRSTGRSARKALMSGERWRTVYQLNSYVNGKISPASDADIYGKDEYWAFPADAGDCEDYVLLKKRYLEKLGFARSSLLITVVLDERNEGHAVLTLRTEEGDFVLDNRRNDIRRWSDLDYVFLKRQSDRDPRDWVALGGGGLTAAAMLTAAEAGATKN
jgi:predicted transglutaminase-like cysteine proteinase